MGMSVAELSFETLYHQEFPYVVRSLRRLGAAPADVADLCHEVFLAVFRKLQDFDRSRPVRPWLFGFAFRAVSDAKGRAFRTRETSDDGLSEVASDADPHSSAERSAARRMVLEALDTLPEERRAVFILHELDGCSAPDIAASLGVPLNTVYSRLRVARGEMTAALEARLRGGSR